MAAKSGGGLSISWPRHAIRAYRELGGPHDNANASDSEDAILFSMNDSPVLQPLAYTVRCPTRTASSRK